MEEPEVPWKDEGEAPVGSPTSRLVHRPSATQGQSQAASRTAVQKKSRSPEACVGLTPDR